MPDIEKYAPQSGRVIGDDNKIYNIVDLLQGRGGGGGDAQPEHVLDGKTFTNDSGQQTGTMSDQGNLNVQPSDRQQEFPAGYYSSIIVQVQDQPGGTALTTDVRAGKTFRSSAGAGELIGMMPDNGSKTVTPSGEQQTLPTGYYDEVTIEPFSPTKQTIETNAQNFSANGDSYVLTFESALPDVNNNLLVLSIAFMDDGVATWEYETGKNLNITAMSFSVMKVNGELVANKQTVDLGSASMSINIGSSDIQGGVVSFDIVFTPSAGTVTINNNQPMMAVDVWSF